MTHPTVTDEAGITTVVDGNTLTITFNRPERRNAINAAMNARFVEILQRTASDKTIAHVVITGAGSAFSAGHDVTELTTISTKPDDPIRIPGTAARATYALPQVTIAMINGPAIGEGLDIALACDFLVAAEGATFADPHLKYGNVPSLATWLLPRLIGATRAADILILGERFGAERALELGLLNKVVPADELERAVSDLVTRLDALPAIPLRYTKRAIQKAAVADMEETLEHIAYARRMALIAR